MMGAALRTLLVAAFLLGWSGAVAAARADPDLNLADWSRQAFSDHGSHMGLVYRDGKGLGRWDYRSAWAFGSAAAGKSPARAQFESALTLEVAGADALFAQAESRLRSYPYWAFEDAQEKGVEASVATLYVGTDVVLLVATFKNRSRHNLKVKPVWRFAHRQEGAEYTGELTKDSLGEFVLAMDRGKLVQRDLVEHAAFMIGGGRSQIGYSGPGADSGKLLPGVARKTGGGFELTLKPAQWQPLGAGQRLRFPLMVSVAQNPSDARKAVTGRWKGWAETKRGYATATARWRTTRSRLPQPPDKKYTRLLQRSAVALKHSEYAARGALNYPMFSAAKAYDDAFYSHRLAAAALGWADLDMGKSQQALMQLISPAAEKAAPVPPHTGEDLFDWEAAGLPLHGLVSWDLYQRDGHVTRAEQFIRGFGQRMLNESKWWPSNRDGDGNGLYAFADDEEKPAYLLDGAFGEKSPLLKASSSESRDAALGEAARFVEKIKSKNRDSSLQEYSLALTSLVGWQFQASAAMAQRQGDAERASALLGLAQHSAKAMRERAFNHSRYTQGLDGLFPFLTGLDSDPQRARAAIENYLLPSAEGDLPFVENKVLVPWRALLMLKTLSLFGYHSQADQAAAKLLAFFEDRAGFFSAYGADGKPQGSPGDSASAAAVLAMAMERYQAESLLLPDTKTLVGRMLQVRSPQGDFFLKVTPPKKKEAYTLLSLAAPEGGSIWDENALILTANSQVEVTLITAFPVDAKQMDSNKWQKNKKQLKMTLKAKKRYLFKFHRSEKAVP